MKNLYAVAAFMLLAAGTASAGETGIINQAGPYEAQMKFYLHPALGFPGAPEAPAASDRAVDSRQGSELTATPRVTAPSAPAIRASHAARNRSDRIASAGRR